MYPAQLESTSLLPRYRPRYIPFFFGHARPQLIGQLQRNEQVYRPGLVVLLGVPRGRMTSSYSRRKISNSFRLRAGQCNEKIQLSCLGQLRTSKQDIYTIEASGQLNPVLVGQLERLVGKLLLLGQLSSPIFPCSSKQKMEQLERIDKQDSATSQLTQFILDFRLVALLRNLAFEISTYLDSR